MALAVGIMMSCLFLRKIQQRKAYVSEIDPASGYRCRFTISAAWNIDVPTVWDSSGEDMGCASFTASPPGPVSRWISARLLHRPPSDPARIHLAISTLDRFPRGLKDGYPRAVSFSRSQPLVLQHLHIHGCPATLCQSEGKRYGKPCRATFLFVYAPTPKMMYVVFGLSDISNSDQIYREIQDIGASFRVENARIPVSGKR
jgi:hypothetical protein